MGQHKAGAPPAPKHAAGPRRRAARPAPKRRLKPRYGRVVVAGSAAGITVVALFGGLVILPMQETLPPSVATTTDIGPQAAGADRAAAQLDPASAVMEQARAYAAQLGAERQQATEESARTAREVEQAEAAKAAAADAAAEETKPDTLVEGVSLPVDSGRGPRAVFDMSAQRVWIVGSKGKVERTYLVSGSIEDNLEPGSYKVYSRSRHAVGVDDSGEMEFFVRFARGKKAAIGFHSIPTQDGKPLQTRAQLGTPRSHGCIRQARPDAIAMWEFARVGTKVVVTA